MSDAGHGGPSSLPATTLPSAGETVVAGPTPLPPLPPTPESTPAPAQDTVTQPSVRYEITAVLDWTAHTVQVVQHVFFRNDTGRAQEMIVFNVEVNREPDYFVMKRISTGGNTPIEDYMLSETRLTVSLADPLPVDGEIELILEFDLAIPQIEDGYAEGHLGYWGYSPRQVNLGMWFPLVAFFDPSQGWLTPRVHWLGEHFLFRAADFAVELQIEGASDAVVVAGPGEMTRPDDRTWRFELLGAREVALSISEQFKTLPSSTASGVQVELFYLPTDVADSLDAPRHALNTAVDALALYEELYGPYPYTRMVVVQGDFPDGMECSGLVFVSDDWFRTWQGIPNDWLTIITAHEVAHQWWYMLVGNDQGNHPYLDEALAIYSEVLFFERYYPDLSDWWWEFRVNMYVPTGYVDATVYDFYSPRGYINAVYLRGALMMARLRNDLGDDAFFAWLRQYAQQMQGQIAMPADFWGAMPPESYIATLDTRTRYLQRSEVLQEPQAVSQQHTDELP